MMNRTQWNAYRCFADNAPDYWIVSTKAFKGRVIATCDNEASATAIAKALNCHEQLVEALKFLIKQSQKRDDAPDNELDIAWAEAQNALQAAGET